MPDREKVIKGLECLITNEVPCDGCSYNEGTYCLRNIANDALELLKEQEESIPVSWLKEKLEGHPELPYATTDGINYVLDLWEER